MTAIDKFRKMFEKSTDKKGDQWLEKVPAWLGRKDGTVATDTYGLVYVRTADGQVLKVFNNNKVDLKFNLLVRIGRHKDEPNIGQIEGRREAWDVPAASGVMYHHEQHEFMGPDMVMLDRRQIIQLSVLVYDSTNFIVQIFGGFVRTASGVVQIASQQVDLSSYVVTVGAIFINMEVDDDGVLSIHQGNNFGAVAVAQVSDIPVPAEGKYILAVIMLYEAQTELTNDDIRVPMPLGIIPKSTGLQIGEATEGTPEPTSLFGYWNVTSQSMMSISMMDLMDMTTQYNDGVHAHGLARWVSSGGTTFELPDVAETVTMTSDNGSIVDPLTYSLSADGTQIIFDASVTAGNIVTAEYIVARI
jgi:hypothetical protein